MARFHPVWIALVLLAFAPAVRADAFDRYINPILLNGREAEGVKKVAKLTPDLIIEHSRVLPGVAAAFVMVETNEGRMSKLLVQTARKRMNDEAKTLVPIVLIERFVTYRPGTEQTVHASAQNVFLFDGFHYSLDLGQVVPAKFGGDLRFVAGDKETCLEPLGNAKMYLLTKPLADAAPGKSVKFVIGETFEPRYFNGKYKLYDDGRRSGTLILNISNAGDVSGAYFSDKDGQKYEVTGKVGTTKHSIQFSVKFPRTEQNFQGWMFTGTGRTITGSSKMQDREAGFYATRVEEE